MKRCSRCKNEASRELFLDSARYRDGKAPWCKPCRRAYHKARRVPKPKAVFVMPTEKTCRGCGVTKSLDEFYEVPRVRDGRDSRCKPCRRPPKIGRAHLVKPDKSCSKCKTRKDKSEFYKSDVICKVCRKIVDSTRSRNSSPEVARAKGHRRRMANKDLPAFTHLLTADEVSELLTDMPSCLKCGAVDQLHLDHVFPVALGGKSIFWNYQVLCIHCNCSKGATEIDYRNGMYA